MVRGTACTSFAPRLKSSKKLPGLVFVVICRVLRAGSAALRERLQSALLRVHEDRHVAVRVLVHVHELVTLARFGELEDARKTGIDLAGHDEVVDALRLLVVREMRALEAFLLHPVITQVE